MDVPSASRFGSFAALRRRSVSGRLKQASPGCRPPDNVCAGRPLSASHPEIELASSEFDHCPSEAFAAIDRLAEWSPPFGVGNVPLNCFIDAALEGS